MSELMTAGEREVRERAAAAMRLAGLYTEEANGLLWSLSSAKPLQWSKDPEKQARFLLGFNEGCEMLRVARQVAVAPEDAA